MVAASQILKELNITLATPAAAMDAAPFMSSAFPAASNQIR